MMEFPGIMQGLNRKPEANLAMLVDSLDMPPGFPPLDIYSSQPQSDQDGHMPENYLVERQKMQIGNTELQVSYGSTRGKRPGVNEDSELVKKLTLNNNRDLGVFLLADGMGGQGNGQAASELAISTAASFLPQALENGAQVLQALQHTVYESSNAIDQMNQKQHGKAGSAFTGFIIEGNMAYVINVGDSQTYVYHARTRKLQRISRPHNAFWQGMQAGDDPNAPYDENRFYYPEKYPHPYTGQPMTKDEAHLLKTSPMSPIAANGMYQRLGGEKQPQTQLVSVPLEAGDIMLSVCDGIWDFVEDQDVEKICQKNENDMETLTKHIFQASASLNSTDNMSVIAVKKMPSPRNNNIPASRSPFVPPQKQQAVLPLGPLPIPPSFPKQQIHASPFSPEANNIKNGHTPVKHPPYTSPRLEALKQKQKEQVSTPETYQVGNTIRVPRTKPNQLLGRAIEEINQDSWHIQKIHHQNTPKEIWEIVSDKNEVRQLTEHRLEVAKGMNPLTIEAVDTVNDPNPLGALRYVITRLPGKMFYENVRGASPSFSSEQLQHMIDTVIGEPNWHHALNQLPLLPRSFVREALREAMETIHQPRVGDPILLPTRDLRNLQQGKWRITGRDIASGIINVVDIDTGQQQHIDGNMLQRYNPRTIGEVQLGNPPQENIALRELDMVISYWAGGGLQGSQGRFYSTNELRQMIYGMNEKMQAFRQQTISKEELHSYLRLVPRAGQFRAKLQEILQIPA